VRQAIQELSADAVELRQTRRDRLDRRAIRNARRHWNRFAMADSTGREVTRGQALTGATLIAHWLRRHHPNEQMVGVLLPPSVAAALTNFGITLAGAVPVNLNYTAGRESVESAAAQCEIRTVITSRAFLAKTKLTLPCQAEFIEDIQANASTISKAQAFLAALVGQPILAAAAFQTASSPLATVIFSSGSTGAPKGVMLTHYNAIANIEAIAQVFQV